MFSVVMLAKIKSEAARLMDLSSERVNERRNT